VHSLLSMVTNNINVSVRVAKGRHHYVLYLSINSTIDGFKQYQVYSNNILSLQMACGGGKVQSSFKDVDEDLIC
jgi:hypothetical protein